MSGQNTTISCANNINFLGFQIASSIAHLHSLKTPITHRDIKPANVMLCKNRHGYPILKLTDFGLSRIADVKENPATTFMMSTVGGIVSP